MGRHTFGSVWSAPTQRRARRHAALGFGLAVVGTILLVFGLVSLIGNTPDPPTSDAASTTTAGSSTTQTTTRTTTRSVPTPTTTLPTQPTPTLLPVTVVNNSTLDGLAALVAGVLETNGWEIETLLNYSETQIDATTAFYTPGDAAQEAAAQSMIAQFPEIAGGAEPRFDGLAGEGLTLAVVGDWVPES